MKITGTQLEEALKRAGIEVKRIPRHFKDEPPATLHNIEVDRIADAINAIPGIAMIETMQLIGVKGGKEEDLGEAPLSSELKAREICRQYGEDPDDEDSLIMGALEALIDWQNKQRIAE